jgi:hypothetical protein
MVGSDHGSTTLRSIARRMVLGVGVVGVPRVRRKQLTGDRRRQVVVRFSDAELELVRRAAEVSGSGQALGGWIGEVAVRASERPGGLVVADRQARIRQLVRLRLDVAALPGSAEVCVGWTS